MSDKELTDYKRKSQEMGTGSSLLADETVRVIYPFQNYEIVVRLSKDGKFIGIDEVSIKKDFRSYTQDVIKKTFSSIDDYVPE